MQRSSPSDRIVPAMVAASGAEPGRRVPATCCGHGNVSAALGATGAKATGAKVTGTKVTGTKVTGTKVTGTKVTGTKVMGLDLSPAFLETARVPGAEFVEGDAEAMPFDEAAFETVTCDVGLGHLPDPAAAGAETARVLPPSGWRRSPPRPRRRRRQPSGWCPAR